jgi:hypothetical protein
VGAHKDPGVLTLLMIEPGKVGLQIETAGGWVDAPAVPGALVVNIGDLLEYATDGYLKATVHRVVSPPPGETRLSIPFSSDSALDSAMPRIELPAELAARVRGVSQDLGDVISGTFGDNLLEARLRAHPDVAAAHHPDLLAPRRQAQRGAFGQFELPSCRVARDPLLSSTTRVDRTPSRDWRLMEGTRDHPDGVGG